MIGTCVNLHVEWYLQSGWVVGEAIKLTFDVCDCCNFDAFQLVARRLANPIFYTDPPLIEQIPISLVEGRARLDLLGGQPIYLNDSGFPEFPNTVNLQWVSETGLIVPGSDEDWYMGPSVEITFLNVRRVYGLEVALLAKCGSLWFGSRIWRIRFLNKRLGTQYPPSYSHPAFNYSETSPP